MKGIAAMLLFQGRKIRMIRRASVRHGSALTKGFTRRPDRTLDRAEHGWGEPDLTRTSWKFDVSFLQQQLREAA